MALVKQTLFQSVFKPTAIIDGICCTGVNDRFLSKQYPRFHHSMDQLNYISIGRLHGITAATVDTIWGMPYFLPWKESFS